MNRHAAMYTLLASLDMSAHGIESAEAQILRSATIDSPEVRPFIIAKWGRTNPLVRTMADEVFEVWVYDEESYVRIDAILQQIRDAILDNPETLGDVKWNGYSEDLYDDIYKCPTRYSAFTLPAGTN